MKLDVNKVSAQSCEPIERNEQISQHPKSCGDCPHMAKWLTTDHPFWCAHPARIWQDLTVVDGYPLAHDVNAGRWSECPYSRSGDLMTDDQLFAALEEHIKEFRESARNFVIVDQVTQ